MGPTHHLSFCACNTAWLAPELLVSMDPSPLSVVFACKIATFGAELQVSMGPRPHLWILNAKHRLLDQNDKSLWDPALTCGFWLQTSVFWYRIISLYGSQTSPVTLCMQNIGTRFSSLYGSPTSPVVLCTQNNVLHFWFTSLYGFQPLSVFF